MPHTNQMVGLTTAIAGLMALQSRKEGRMIEIDPALHAFDFPVPESYDYQFDPDLGEIIPAPLEEPANPEPVPIENA